MAEKSAAKPTGKPVQRKGDANSKGGTIKTGVNSVRVNGVPIAVAGLSVSPHLPCPIGASHCDAKTTFGSKTVRADGKPIVVTGAKDTCGDPREGGSPNVRAA